MTDEPIVEVPGYTRPEPEPEAAPRGGFLIDVVPFTARTEEPAPPVPVRAEGFIDSVPMASMTERPSAPEGAPAIVGAMGEPSTAPVPVAVVPQEQVPVPGDEAPSLPAAPAIGATWANAPTKPVAPGAMTAIDRDDDPFADWLAAPATEVPAPHVAAMLEDHDEVDVTRRVELRVATVTLTWDDGTMTYVTKPTLVGRNPAQAGADVAVAIADATLSLSKTHARVTSSPPSIEDLDSTNGIGLERAGHRVDVPPRQVTSLAAGDVLYFGNRRVVVEVVS